MSVYRNLVAAGGGRMRGEVMLAGWKNMHPGEQYLTKYIDLYNHVEDAVYVARSEHFERWFENALDLPGRYYLQAIEELFKANRFAKGEFIGLGRKLSPKNIKVFLYLLAGQTDDITTREQVFAAAHLVVAPCSHCHENDTWRPYRAVHGFEDGGRSVACDRPLDKEP